MALRMFKDGNVTPCKSTGEILEEQDAAELLKKNPPEDPFAAAIDKATGFSDTGKDGRSIAPEPQPKEAGAEASQTEKRDWVEEAYKCFIKDAGDIDPTDPVKAVEAYFEKNATDELKQRCKAEGKDAKGCWKFIEAVARKALGGSSGHIDPGVVYAIAMHWFEDVPKDWDKLAKVRRSAEKKPVAKKPAVSKSKKIEKLEEKIAQGRVSVARKKELKAELAAAKRKERAKAAKAARPDARKKKPKDQQGFFFDMLEMQPDGAKNESEVVE